MNPRPTLGCSPVIQQELDLRKDLHKKVPEASVLLETWDMGFADRKDTHIDLPAPADRFAGAAQAESIAYHRWNMCSAEIVLTKAIDLHLLKEERAAAGRVPKEHDYAA